MREGPCHVGSGQRQGGVCLRRDHVGSAPFEMHWKSRKNALRRAVVADGALGVWCGVVAHAGDVCGHPGVHRVGPGPLTQAWKPVRAGSISSTSSRRSASKRPGTGPARPPARHVRGGVRSWSRSRCGERRCHARGGHRQRGMYLPPRQVVHRVLEPARYWIARRTQLIARWYRAAASNRSLQVVLLLRQRESVLIVDAVVVVGHGDHVCGRDGVHPLG